jgi:hypothetical protein
MKFINPHKNKQLKNTFILWNLSISRYNSDTLEDPSFRHVRKTAKSDYWLPHVCLPVCVLPSVRPSVRKEQLGSHWTYCYYI